MLTASEILDPFINRNGADIYLTVGACPTMRTEGDTIVTLSDTVLTEDMIREFLPQILSEDAIGEFDSTLEYNTAIEWNQQARLRINVFRQRQHTGIVLRRIRTEIPTLESLHLPATYSSLALEKRGLVLIVGQTGSGKSTSMAAMLEHRNINSHGHIVTIEDPVEFVHEHKGCIVTQRDVGVDTYSFGIALKNVLRQRPDVIVIGEIRDRETMDHALVFSETGHLCIATLHAGNASQAVERIINFFPEERHRQVLLSLSINLRGMLCQRLVSNLKNQRSLVTEILLNQGLMKNLLHDGKLTDIAQLLERSRDTGMMTFDQCLLDLLNQGIISEAVALAESDNPSNMRLQITQKDMSKRLGAKEKLPQLDHPSPSMHSSGF